eukprot:TRINITY_DN9320_c0_g1_i1.p1 TRINITY_DN9320_c0_g1~~TRINITY_DN9320_c0_g1_i1.p1  ORF type:complete len:411 (+),score=49.10 TRINITY_DN9320_c0_g1_i1:79-1311(+)
MGCCLGGSINTGAEGKQPANQQHIELDAPVAPVKGDKWVVVETEGPGPGRRSGHTLNSLWVDGDGNGGLLVLGGISKIRDKVDQLFGSSQVRVHKNSLISGGTYLLNLRTNMWTPLHLSGSISEDDIPGPRGFHTSVYVKGCIYTIGSDQFDCDSIFKLQFQQGTWKRLHSFGDRPPRLAHHTSFIHNGIIYIHGGVILPHGASKPLRISTLYSFDPDSCVWTSVKTTSDDDVVIEGISDHTSVVHGNSVYMFGGTTDGGEPSGFLRLNLDTWNWSAVECENTPPARSSHTCSVWRDYLVIVGGLTGGEICPDFLVYNIAESKWLPKKLLVNTPAAFHASAVIAHDTLFVYGGDTLSGIRSQTLSSIHLPSLLNVEPTALSTAGQKYQTDVTDHYHECLNRNNDEFNTIM